MLKFSLIVSCAVSLWIGMALAMPTPQQACDYARITAWKMYTSCIDTVVAKDAKLGAFEFAGHEAFAKCRHAYFKKWTGFQTKASLQASTCIGARYTDNGDQTVTDNLSGLTWEKKDTAGGIHDTSNTYTWSVNDGFYPEKENGTAFTAFLSTVNAEGFGSANGWRLPTLAELQTILLDFPCRGAWGSTKCTCPSLPCVDPALGAANTQFIYSYWSATSYVPLQYLAWGVNFGDGLINPFHGPDQKYVRAVRGGL